MYRQWGDRTKLTTMRFLFEGHWQPVWLEASVVARTIDAAAKATEWAGESRRDVALINV
jgi:hypothetical protein